MISQLIQDQRVWWRSSSLQVITCLGFGVFLPSLIYFQGDLAGLLANESAITSLFASSFAGVAGVFFARRVHAYPGVNQLNSLIPSFTLAFGLSALIILILRVDYSGILLLLSLGTNMVAYAIFMSVSLRLNPNVFYAVPGGRIGRLAEFGIEAKPLSAPISPSHRGAIIIADLHQDMNEAWERMLAHAALRGIPVFHYKQIYENFAGKVQIEHLSENNLGSLLPDLQYIRAKQVLDIFTSLLVAPLLILPFLVISLWIKLDSPGPAFFVQERVGYGGRTFRIIKFRTMHSDGAEESSDCQKARATTVSNDPRITKAGRLLRRTRMDELPQVLNIIKGDMSWIGPRPEALALASWYEQDVPFYSYRHIVRPGLTGWAQVNQGHVASISEIHDKLQYDLYYIKKISLWLDVLVLFKTATVLVTGSGAK